MCENNTLFLSRAWRYFLLNGHTVVDGRGEVDLVFVGGCAVTDEMRRWCEGMILQSMKRFSHSRFIVFGCLAAFPEGLESVAGGDTDRLHIIPYRASRKLDELIQARIPYDTVHVSRLKGHIPYQPRIGPEDSYVLIAQGCVNHCSYCNIKKVKGNVISRSTSSGAMPSASANTGTITGEISGKASVGRFLYSNKPTPIMQIRRITVIKRFFRTSSKRRFIFTVSS